MYWWPPVELWDARFGHVGWNPEAEASFEAREEEILKSFTPLSRTEWRDRLRISSTFKAALTAVENLSQSFIDNWELARGL